MNTRDVILGVVAVAGLSAVLWFGANQADAPRTGSVASAQSAEYFKDIARAKVVAEIGQPIEGFTPEMFMQVYPGLVASDFEGVEALNGRYTVEGGQVVFKLQVNEGDPITSADGAIEDAGMRTLLENIGMRLGMDVSTKADVDAILTVISRDNDIGANPPSGNGGGEDDDDEWVACTMDAKMCPDGSFVGRTGPRCEFAACPAYTGKLRTCPDEWIENRMPGPPSATPKEYYILNGARRELSEFDQTWVRNNCQLEKQIVY